MRSLDALLRPLASLPPGLPVVAAAPPEVIGALTALGFSVSDLDQRPDGSAAWGVVVGPAHDAGASARRLRSRLASGAWLSLVVLGEIGATDLVGVLEDAGYALAQVPEAVTEGDGTSGLHVVVRRVDPGIVA